MENKENPAQDLLIDVATGHSRTCRTWRNERITWSELANRCRTPRVSGETMDEYLALPRMEQTRLKDVGGFVGGYLTNGVRKNGMVAHRSVVTIDIDNGNAHVWQTFCQHFGCAAFLYSTRKHNGTTAFRYRLVVLLSRPVRPEEYEPIARYVAAKVGNEMTDGTTHDLPRLFFYPSCCKGAPFVFEEQKGPALDVDAILPLCQKTDSASALPQAPPLEINTGLLRRKMTKQGEPTQKPGIVGAFCRTYSIEQAVELTKAYSPTATPGRYTYNKGSMVGGLVTYDGKFAYSHHGTDPASQKLCNAFDLVRIHLFGHLDNGSTFSSIKLAPSHKAMVDYAFKDNRVLEQMMTADTGNPLDLELDKKGNPQCTIANITKILTTDPKLRGKLYHDAFVGYDYADDDLPWKRNSRMWTDRDEACLRGYIETNYGITGQQRIYDALIEIFNNNSRHPVREYLNTLVWDGQPRLDRIIVSYLGAEDTALNRAITRKMFTAAVARVMQPGIKFDHCLVLVGGEGIGKSSFLKKMGRDWFSDSLATMDGRDAMEALRGVWIIELAELCGMKRSELEQQKNFLSKQTDRYREAYGRNSVEVPRQCVFFASTNEDKFLKGDTGNRRMWVMQTNAKLREHPNGPFDLTDKYIDQVYAEALTAFRNGEELMLPPELETEIRKRQAEYNVEVEDPLPGLLADFLNQPLPSDWYEKDQSERRIFFVNHTNEHKSGFLRTKFCATEFAMEYLGMVPRDRDYNFTIRKINRLVSTLPGWERTVAWFSKYGTQRGWRKVEETDKR